MTNPLTEDCRRLVDELEESERKESERKERTYRSSRSHSLDTNTNHPVTSFRHFLQEMKSESAERQQRRVSREETTEKRQQRRDSREESASLTAAMEIPVCWAAMFVPFLQCLNPSRLCWKQRLIDFKNHFSDTSQTLLRNFSERSYARMRHDVIPFVIN